MSPMTRQVLAPLLAGTFLLLGAAACDELPQNEPPAADNPGLSSEERGVVRQRTLNQNEAERIGN